MSFILSAEKRKHGAKVASGVHCELGAVRTDWKKANESNPCAYMKTVHTRMTNPHAHLHTDTEADEEVLIVLSRHKTNIVHQSWMLKS